MKSSQDDLSNLNANLEDALRGLKPVGVEAMQKGRDRLQYELGYQAGKRNSAGWQLATWALALTLVGSWTFNRSVNHSVEPSENWSSNQVPQNENLAVISDPLPERAAIIVSYQAPQEEDLSTPIQNILSQLLPANRLRLPIWFSWIGNDSPILTNNYLESRQQALTLGVDSLPEFRKVSRSGHSQSKSDFPLSMGDGIPWEMLEFQ
jgi:hypothetical protein